MLFVAVAATLLIWYPSTRFNLPVAANVDERNGIAVLHRFRTTGLNPHFFFYPTFYYYVTHFATAAWPASRDLPYGRVLNMAVVGLTGWIAYLFCLRYFCSRAAGLIAAAGLILSPILAASGAWLCTDVFLTAATLGTAYFLTGFFQHNDRGSWLGGMIAMGLAVACKQTASVLFLAYVVCEVWRGLQQPQTDVPRLPRVWLSAAGSLAGASLLVLAAFFPIASVLDFVAKNRYNPNLRSMEEYFRFFHALRIRLAVIGGLATAAAALILLSRRFYQAVSMRRMYQGLLIILAIFLITTPFSFLAPKEFLYVMGAFAKTNLVPVIKGGPQWNNYAVWYQEKENLFVGMLAVAGMCLLGKRLDEYRFPLIFMGIYLLVIGPQPYGFPRYLAPLLALFYCFSGYAFTRIRRLAGRALLLVCLVISVFYFVIPRVREANQRDGAHDEFWESYQTILKLHPAKVFFAEYAPNAELLAAGFHVEEIPVSALSDPAALTRIGCRDVLVFNKSAGDGVDRLPSAMLTRVLNRDGVDGQEVFVQEACR